MVKRIVQFFAVAVAAVVMGLLATPFASASPSDYPAPPVTSGWTQPPSPVTSQQMMVLGTSRSGSLPNTGTGFDVGITAGIAVAVVLLGAALIVLGSRRTLRSRHR